MTTGNLDTRARRIALLLVLVAISLLAVSPAGAQSDQPGGCGQGDAPSGCAEITLYPEALTGDFYVGDARVAAGTHAARIGVAASSSVRITARNVRDGSPDYGEVYSYGEAATSVWVAAGQTRAYVLRPKKELLVGFAEVRCAVPGLQTGEDVQCNVRIDGQRIESIAPADTRTYTLSPGDHEFELRLSGTGIDRWEPVAVRTLTIRAGQTTIVTPTFVLLPQPVPSAAAKNVQIRYIRYRGHAQPFTDIPQNESDEYVLISNRGSVPVSMQGWRLTSNTSRAVFEFPEYELAPYASLQVYTNVDRPGSTFSFKWHRQIWDNAGGTAYLYDQAGAVVSVYSYGTGGLQR